MTFYFCHFCDFTLCVLLRLVSWFYCKALWSPEGRFEWLIGWVSVFTLWWCVLSNKFYLTALTGWSVLMHQCVWLNFDIDLWWRFLSLSPHNPEGRLSRGQTASTKMLFVEAVWLFKSEAHGTTQPPVTKETCKQVSSLLFPMSQGSGLTVESCSFFTPHCFLMCR